MAGLGALLGGYGSDEDEDHVLAGQQEASSQGLPLLAGTAASPAVSPAGAAAGPSAAAADDGDIDAGRMGPGHVMDGPSTDPEPPPKGLSPLSHTLAGANDEGGAEGIDAAADPHYLLPPELREPVPGDIPLPIQEAFNKLLYGYRSTGKTIISQLKGNRRWANPDFLEKMVEFYNLDQYGTALQPEVWEPKNLSEEDFWPSLAQQLQARKRARGGEVQFRSAGQHGGDAAVSSSMSGQQGSIAGAPKMLPPDPRKVQQVQAQVQALANALLSGAKKSKWDK